MRASRAAVLFLPVGLAVGCGVGRISEPTAPMPPPAGSPSPSPSTSSSPSPSPSTSPSPSPTQPPVDPCTTVDPGRTTIHRLNRAEYDNTVRDLFDEELRPAQDFPPDDHGFGFDNNADVLATSPLLFEKYEAAAGVLVGRALERPVIEIDRRWEAEQLGGSQGAEAGDYWNLYTNGEVTTTATVAVAGEYELVVGAYQQAAGPDPASMEVSVDNRLLRAFAVTALAGSPGTYTVRATLTAGAHTITAAFTNDYYEPNVADRNLMVDYLRLHGPFGVAAPDPAKRARIMICTPTARDDAACARNIFAAFGRRAWRRPLEAGELDRLVTLARVAWSEGDDFDVGIGLGLQGILLSPSFAFRPELDPNLADTTPHALDDHALAARLSYFLWSSMPDEALSGRADRGELSRPEILAAEVRRMLRDPKAKALTDNFAGQWLYTRALENVSPDYQLYPRWSVELGASMRAETEAFFSAFLTEDRSALDLIDADFSFLDDRLAQYYGVPAPGSRELTRVPLGASVRRGLITQGSLLTVTSHARRTSPVKRGKWVLENLLCSAPPAPPPGVEGIPEEVNPQASLRERTEQHRAVEPCKGCHANMDPIGFSLEHFDAIGGFRERDGNYAIDDSAALPDGSTFQGASGLAAYIKAEPRFSRCITEKLFTYSLGRGPTGLDKQCNIPAIDRQFAAGGHRLEQLVQSLVASPAFLQRKAEGN